MDSTRVLTGGCLCGAVRYECAPPVPAATLCHCTSCRRGSGAHAVAWMTVKRSQLRLLAAEPAEFASSAQVRRGFCPRCGTSLTYSHGSSSDTVDVTVASLDEPGRVAPVDHTWMSDAVAWDRPADGLAQHPRTRQG